MFDFKVQMLYLGSGLIRSVVVWEIYGNILQLDINLFSLLICTLPVYVTPSQLTGECIPVFFISHLGWTLRGQLLTVIVTLFLLTVTHINMASRYFLQSCVVGRVEKVKQFHYKSLLLLGIQLWYWALLRSKLIFCGYSVWLVCDIFLFSLRWKEDLTLLCKLLIILQMILWWQAQTLGEGELSFHLPVSLALGISGCIQAPQTPLQSGVPGCMQ